MARETVLSGKYTAYPEYKNSEVEWLGELPRHWFSTRVKYGYEIKLGKMLQKDPKSAEDELKPYLKAVNIQTYGVALEQVGKMWFSPLDMRSLKLMDGDVLISEGGDVGRSAIWNNQLPDCYIQNAIARARAQKNRSSRFLFYWMNMLKVSEYIDILCNKATIAHYTAEKVENSPLFIPSDAEAETISNFLDYETAKIDTLIDKQQQLITLLKEKRQAVISHAVTKGLNPNAPMRDSGVEWLGEVPEHWVSCALGKVTLSKCDGPFGSGLKSEHYTDSGVRVIRLQNIKMGKYFDGEGAFINEEYYKNNLRNHDVEEGDVLIAGLGDPRNPVGRACIAPKDISPAMVKADCFRFRLDENKVIPSFVAQQLSASSFHDAGKLSNGSTRARIPLNLMTTRRIAICPKEEQLQILDHINRLSSQYDRLQKEAELAIELMQERRAALISAAVTGKMDVRNWQASATTNNHKEVAV
jgi:type I restriction enzyme S subunit